MDLARPWFRTDPTLERIAMERLQRDVAAVATFSDALNGVETICGIDQAFDGDEAVSAAVVMRDGQILEQATARAPAPIPYIPGLLSFRELPAIVEVLRGLTADPDCLLVDGSGRIHFRQAGLATHVGVLFDRPAIGVAKRLLCGTSADSTADRAAGDRVAIHADADVDVSDGTTIGYALQTRQFDSPNRHINPLYVSPGHRVSATTAADRVLKACTSYKLPDPIRAADQLAGRAVDH
ncbi:MAG: endonuclease V [Salinarchaeum sp.]